METRTDVFLQEVRENLTSNILPYWLKLKDPRGGFYGEVLSDGKVLYDAPRGVILNARLIWAFSAAYAALKDTQYLVVYVLEDGIVANALRLKINDKVDYTYEKED